MAFVDLLCMLTLVTLVPSVSATQPKLEPTQYSQFRDPVDPHNIEPFICPASDFEPFFTMTRFVMSTIVGTPPLPAGYTAVNDGTTLAIGPKVQRNEWFGLITHNWLITLIVMILIIIAVVVPLIGLCICIRESQENDDAAALRDGNTERQSVARLCCFSVLLAVLTLGLLFGFVAAFVTSNYLVFAEKDYEAATWAAAFFSTKTSQLNRRLVGNYTQMAHRMQRLLYTTVDDIKQQLIRNSMEGSRGFLKHYQQQQQVIVQTLADMLRVADEVHHRGVQVTDALRGVRRQFCDQFVNFAKIKGTSRIPFSPYYMDVVRRFDTPVLGDNGIRCRSLPHIHTTIANLKTFFDDAPIITGINDMNKIDLFIKDSSAELDIKVKLIVDVLSAACDVLKKIAKDIQVETIKFIAQITADTVVDDLQSKYDPYRFCIGILAGSALLLICICLLCALLCGICGGRGRAAATGRNRCFNRSDAALFLMGAAALIFAFIPLLALSALGHFLPGIIAYRVYCDSAAAGNRAFDYTIAGCRKNQSIYAALNANGKRIGGLDEFKQYNEKIQNLLLQLRHMEMGLEKAQPTMSKLMSDKDRRKFETLMANQALIDFKEAKILDNLEHEITPKPVTHIFDRRYPRTHELSGPLMQAQIDNLDQFNGPILEPVYQEVLKLKKLGHELRNAFIYEQHSMRESLELLMHEHDKALKFETKVKCWAYFVDDTLRDFSSSLSKTFARHSSLDDQGNCYELAAAYDMYRNSVCCSYADLICGFWLAILWCLLLFLPILWLAFRLGNIYHSLDPYQEVEKPASSTARSDKSVILPDSLEEQRRSIIVPPTIPPANTVQKRELITAPAMRRTTSVAREVYRSRAPVRRTEDDIKHIFYRRRKSQTSDSSSSSSDMDIVIRRRKTRKE